MRIGIVGCGNIASRYADRIDAVDGLELVAATDVDPGAAERLVAQFGGRAYASLDELLADDAVELVLNLTSPQAHADVSRQALAAGKHVHSEKPLALRHDEAQELVELATRNGVRLSSAPATLLGEAQQSLWKLVRDGAIGRVRVVYAEANWDRIERWHPDPTALYAVGPMVDVGVYPLAILTAMFGPVRRVQAYGTIVEPDRVHGDGRPFRLSAPDFVVALLELTDGVIARLTATFYVPPSKQRGLELHGDDGSLHLAAWDRVRFAHRAAGAWRGVSDGRALREPYHGKDWSRALSDLAAAIAEDRPHRASGEHAAHLVEVLEAVQTSLRDGGTVDVRSVFSPPEPLDWAR